MCVCVRERDRQTDRQTDSVCVCRGLVGGGGRFVRVESPDSGGERMHTCVKI